MSEAGDESDMEFLLKAIHGQTGIIVSGHETSLRSVAVPDTTGNKVSRHQRFPDRGRLSSRENIYLEIERTGLRISKIH